MSRRAALSGALGGAMLALAACGNNDATTLGNGSAGAKATPSTSAATSASPAPSSSPATTSGPATASPSGTAASGPPLPASAALQVAFTFAVSSSGGMVRNPYVAVWVEDGSGSLVKTVALWHESRGGQDRWLSEMREFSGLDASDAQTVSSATKQPGSYTVRWDGATLTGGRAAQGRYRLFVEASREHGPYELVHQDVDLGTQATSFTLTPSGELTAVSAAYSV